MRTIVGLIVSIIGLYFFNSESSADKPVALGIIGVGLLILPGGTDPFLSNFLPILVIIAAVVWGLMRSNK